MNFPITLLGGISCYAIAREVGLTRKEASFAPALICFSPMIYALITTEYVDTAVFAFCSAAVLFALRYLKKGTLHDFLLAMLASGILLGIKFTGIPVAGLILIVTAIKTITLTWHPGFLKKLGVVLLGLLTLCAMGGRQYILNSIDARNPLYPLPIRIMNHEIAEGWGGLDKMNEWISQYEISEGLDKLDWWGRTYRKFYYRSLTAGPKYFLFLILAIVSLFISFRHIPRYHWYFLSMMWIIPITLYYTGPSMDFAKGGYYLDTSTRFLSPYIAIFTIQGLVLLKKLSKYFYTTDSFLLALVAWDLLYVNKTHIQEIGLLYPFVVVLIASIIIIFKLVSRALKNLFSKEGTIFIFGRSYRLDVTTTIRWANYYAIGFIVTVAGIYGLQNYRDHTRYLYYRGYTDLTNTPKSFVNGWEFLDKSNEKKTIALTMGWKSPGHHWFFYPLMGRHLQNNITYVSARHMWDVPTWLHQGEIRGNEYSIWLHNLKRKNVDYVLVQTPWPVESQWMALNEDIFQLMFSDENCKIFRYNRE
ncbi:MAG: glycosyltransferase family 39 protein [Candidatus Thermoplasmatota archaeon]|nr:glycosyltransferase family 39 protein [Candidatus Thermoplasmatota archaeon]